MCHQMSSVTKLQTQSSFSLMFLNAVSIVFLNIEYRHTYSITSLVTSNVLKIAQTSILLYSDKIVSQNLPEKYKSTQIINESSLKDRLRSQETNFKMQNIILFFYSVAFVAGTCENNGLV